MKKCPPYIILFFLSFQFHSCAKKPNLNEIKTPVFGGLVLGESIQNNLEKVNDLESSGKLQYTTNTRLPYFYVRDEFLPPITDFLLFPNLQFNDTLITRIEYYVFARNDTYSYRTKEQGSDENMKENLQDAFYALSEEQRFNYIKSDLTLSKEIDKDTKIRFCNVDGSGKMVNNFVRMFLERKLKEKYTLQVVEERKDDPNISNPMDVNLTKWSTGNMHISLLTQRQNVEGEIRADNYNTVLIYEFSPETTKKYKLNTSSQPSF